MSESITARVVDQTYSIGEPTCELRWLTRLIPPVMEENAFYWKAPSFSVERVLQQRWMMKDYVHGKPIGMRDEWRDVPTATA